MGVYLDDLIEGFFGFFGFSNHGKGSAEAVESGDVLGFFFEDFLVEGDGFVPVFGDGGFDGFLLKIVREVVVHAGCHIKDISFGCQGEDCLVE